MKKLIALLMVLVMALGVAACKPQESAADSAATTDTANAAASDVAATDAPLEPYVFALYAPMTGDNAQYGTTYEATINIYLDKLNAEGGINGHPVELLVYDDKNDPKEALNIANLIVSNPDVIGVIGSQTSSCGLAAAPVFQEEGVPMITPQGSHPDITLVGNYIFRMSCLATFEGGVIANMMIDDGCKNVAVIYANDDYGVKVVDYWTNVVKEAGANVVASETFVSGQTKDFTPLLSKIKAAGADAIYIEPGYSDSAMILAQMSQLDCAFQPYGSSMLYKAEFLEVAGESAEGLILCNFTLPNNTEANYVFISEAYKAATGNLADVYVTNSYDCIALLCDAVKAVGTDGAAMADWLANVKDWQGASGVINFDENRNPAKELYRFRVENGEFVLQEG